MSLLRRWHEPPNAPGWFEGSHDVTGQVSFLSVAAEMRSRWAKRTAREARWRGLWLVWAVRWLRKTVRKPDHAPAGPPEGNSCARCRGGGLCASCVFELENAIEGRVLKDLGPEGVSAAELVDQRLENLDSTQALQLARTIAERDGEGALKDALHYLLVLNMAGAVGDVLPLLARPANGITRALAAQRGDVN